MKRTMGICPICGTDSHNLSTLCKCGYDYDKNNIIDKVKIREYFSIIKSANNWEIEVKLTKRIHEVQQKIRGKSGSWTQSDTGRLLNIPKSTISNSIRLAKTIDEYPEILKYKKITHAIKKLSNFNKGYFGRLMKPFKTEKELQSYLETNWEKIEHFKEWNLKESQIKLGEAGIIDLLAHHKSEPKWLIIEIKKDISSDKTVGQVLRYMGWVKENLACDNEEILGRIISGYPPDENIRLALKINKNIDQQIYFLECDQVKFIDAQTAFDIVKFEKKYPLEEQIELMKKDQSC